MGCRWQQFLPFYLIYLFCIVIFFKQITVRSFKSVNNRSIFLSHPGFPVHRNQSFCSLFCVLPRAQASHTPGTPKCAPEHTLGSPGKEPEAKEAFRPSSPVLLSLMTKQGGSGKARAEAQTILNLLWLAVPDQVVLEEPGPRLLHFVFQHTISLSLPNRWVTDIHAVSGCSEFS